MGNGEDFGFILGKRGNGWVIVRRVAARNDPAVLNPASFPVVVGTIFTWNFTTSALLQVCATYQVACPRAPLNGHLGHPLRLTDVQPSDEGEVDRQQALGAALDNWGQKQMPLSFLPGAWL